MQRKQNPQLLLGRHWFLDSAESLCNMVVKGLCLPFGCLKSIFISSPGLCAAAGQGDLRGEDGEKDSVKGGGSHCSGFLYPYPRVAWQRWVTSFPYLRMCEHSPSHSLKRPGQKVDARLEEMALGCLF